jgi:hypothetical protein
MPIYFNHLLVLHFNENLPSSSSSLSSSFSFFFSFLILEFDKFLDHNLNQKMVSA